MKKPTLHIGTSVFAASLILAYVPTPAVTAARGCNQYEQYKLVLNWSHQAEFAGFYAAENKGYFDEECLTVDIIAGGPTTNERLMLSSGYADAASIFVSDGMSGIAAGEKIINVAQLFQRSATMQVALKESGHSSLKSLNGTAVGSWMGPEAADLTHMLSRAWNVDLEDVRLTPSYDPKELLNGTVQSVQTMRYNEYAVLLETVNPLTGKLYKPSDFVTFDTNAQGSGMLQNSIWIRSDERTGDLRKKHEKFLRAMTRGWVFCRDNVKKCAKWSDRTDQPSHQVWQMNEINKLMWPVPNGRSFGSADASLLYQTATVAGTNVQTSKTFDGSLLTNALRTVDLDLKGQSYMPSSVKIVKGGK